MQTEIDKALELILASLADVIEVYVFGSFAKGEQGKDSDLDLAILAKQKITKLQLWELAQHIAQHINHDVDLVDLRQASTVFGYQIINTGRRLLNRNTVEIDKFELQICSLYLDLNQLRRELLEDIQQRGQIYHG